MLLWDQIPFAQVPGCLDFGFELEPGFAGRKDVGCRVSEALGEMTCVCFEILYTSVRLNPWKRQHA